MVLGLPLDGGGVLRSRIQVVGLNVVGRKHLHDFLIVRPRPAPCRRPRRDAGLFAPSSTASRRQPGAGSPGGTRSGPAQRLGVSLDPRTSLPDSEVRSPSSSEGESPETEAIAARGEGLAQHRGVLDQGGARARKAHPGGQRSGRAGSREPLRRPWDARAVRRAPPPRGSPGRGACARSPRRTEAPPSALDMSAALTSDGSPGIRPSRSAVMARGESGSRYIPVVLRRSPTPTGRRGVRGGPGPE